MNHWLELLLDFLPLPGDLRRSQRTRERTSVGSWLALLGVALLLVAFVWWRNR